MGKVVGAALLAHVPTIMLPEKVRKDLNNGQEISLVPGLKNFAKMYSMYSITTLSLYLIVIGQLLWSL